MPQTAKTHVKDGFVAAAAATFAELGYPATTMAAVAERAGSSVGNLYKYFGNKEELFAAVVPAQLARELRQRTRARIEALGTARDVRELPGNAPYHLLAGDLLDYCLAHRQAVVILLIRAEGTPFATFPRQFVADLVGWALDYAEAAYPALERTAELGFVLTRVYLHFVSGVAAALLQFRDEKRVRKVVSQLTAHHQGGLKLLFETEGETEHAQSRHLSEPPVVSAAASASARHTQPSRKGSSAPGLTAGQADRARRARRRS